MPQRIDVFWTAGHCGRDDILRVRFLLQSRELSVLTERVLEVLKQFAVPKKRDRGKVWSHGNIGVKATDKG